MRRQLFGRDDRSLFTTACRQQGLLHIYAQTCDRRLCATCVVGGERSPATTAPGRAGEADD